MKINVKDESVTVILQGKIDSQNVTETEKELFQKLEGIDEKKIILDILDLKYISSAGLRMLLKLCKKYKNISIINASDDVYEIFRVTGFDQIINIHKPLRNISLEGCPEIARGSIGVIYRLDEDRIIKVYSESVSEEVIQQGRETSQKLFFQEVPCAISYDVVKVGERRGAVYEMIDADTLAQYIMKHPNEVESCADQAALLLQKLHHSEIKEGTLPNIKDVASMWLKTVDSLLTEEQKAIYRKMIHAIPETKNFLHLDYHTKNIMIRDNELLLIDVDDSCTGNPIFDIASIMMTLGRDDLSEEKSMLFVGLTNELRNRYFYRFIRTYYGTENDREIEERILKVMPLTALRQLYGSFSSGNITPEERAHRFQVSQKKVEKYVTADFQF